MKLRWTIIIVVFIAILIAAAALVIIPAPQKAQAPTGSNGGSNGTSPAGIADLIEVTAPTAGQKITSPLTITGRARGTWFFEASAPVELRDASGKTIMEDAAHTIGDWMTADFVGFTATLTYPAQPAGSKGTLILKNDNPSGDPARDKKVEIPVTF